MSNGWQDFDFQDWDDFTFQNWNVFTVTTSAGVFTLVPIGSNNIAVSDNNDGTFKLVISITNTYSDTTEKLFWGGMPLALAKVGNYHALKVVIDNSFNVDNNKKTIINGTFFSLKNLDYRMALNVIEGTETDVYDKTTWCGMHLALNVDNELICIEAVPSEPVTYFNMYVGGMPLTLAYDNTDYYLVVTKI